MSNQKGIILHDYFAVIGGAERLIMTLAQAFDSTDLCVGYRDINEIVHSEMKQIAILIMAPSSFPDTV